MVELIDLLTCNVGINRVLEIETNQESKHNKEAKDLLLKLKKAEKEYKIQQKEVSKRMNSKLFSANKSTVAKQSENVTHKESREEVTISDQLNHTEMEISTAEKIEADEVVMNNIDKYRNHIPADTDQVIQQTSSPEAAHQINGDQSSAHHLETDLSSIQKSNKNILSRFFFTDFPSGSEENKISYVIIAVELAIIASLLQFIFS